MFMFFNDDVTLEEQGDRYLIKGITYKKLLYDFNKVFKTSVIGNTLFIKRTSTSFYLNKFFTIELYWLLDTLVNDIDESSKMRLLIGIRKYNLLLEEIKNNSWIKTTFQTHPNFNLDKALEQFTFKPTKDQRDFLESYSTIKYGYQLKGCLLDAAPGVGKSVCSLFWSKMINDNPTIIIVPKNLITEPWLDHLLKEGSRYCFKKEPKVWHSLQNTSPLKQKCDYYIIYKEQMRKDNINGISFKSLLEDITNKGSKLAKVIIDESHNYNDINSQQTQGIVEFCRSPLISDVLSQTGTPIKAQGKETYPLFYIIDKYFTENVRTQFLKMYGRDNYYLNQLLAHRLGRIKYTIESIEGMDNPPEPVMIPVSFPGVEEFTLKSIRLKMLSYITERVAFYKENMGNYTYDFYSYLEDYRKNHPSDENQLDQYIEIVKRFQKHGYNNFTDSALSKQCKEFEDKVEAELKGKDLSYFRHIKSAVKYVGLKIRGEALGNILGKARIDAVRLSIEHAGLSNLINSVKGKTAIYTSYIEAVEFSEQYLKNEQFNPILLYSKNSTDVDKVISQLRESQSVNPLITTYGTLKEGKPLLMCNQLILLNAPWRSYELKQTIARIYRRGQTRECFVWMLDLDTGTEENITSRSIDIMEWSKEQVEQLLGGGVLVGANGESFSLNVSGKDLDFSLLAGNENFTTNYRKQKLSVTDLFK